MRPGLKNVNADGMNAIVERISGVNPSKMAAEVTGDTVQPGVLQESGAPAAYLPGTTPPPDTNALLQRIAMLEHRLAMVEGGKGPSNRGPESNAWARDMTDQDREQARKMVAKKKADKDPVDGKPDSKEPPDEEESDEEEPTKESAVNKSMIGLDMTEWRRLAGLEEMPLQEDANIPIEDVDDEKEPYEAPTVEDTDLDDLWDAFLHEQGIDPGAFAALIDEAMESGSEEDIDTILAMEELFLQEVNVRLRQRSELTPEFLGVKRRSRVAGLKKLNIRNLPAEKDTEKAKRAVAIVKALPEEEEGEDFSFECDADENGEPSVDWDEVARSHGEKTERGFGGMSRSRF